MLAGSSRGNRSAARRTAPGSSLVEGGFGGRTNARRRAQRQTARDRTRRQTVRVAAPLLVPLALALTLGIILAVSSGTRVVHVNQQTTGTTATKSAGP
jgi:hypothetical protein